MACLESFVIVLAGLLLTLVLSYSYEVYLLMHLSFFFQQECEHVGWVY